MKLSKIITLATFPLFLFSCKKDNQTQESYLAPWVGAYNGTSRHWNLNPMTNGDTVESYKAVQVQVQFSESDSSLKITISYDGEAEPTQEINFLGQNEYTSHWGAGSSEGLLSIVLVSDSLKYHYSQKCGIPCNSGKDFELKKN